MGALVHHVWAVVNVRDAGAAVQWVSPSVQDVLGHRSNELVGDADTDLVHPDDLGLITDAFEALAAGATSPAITARCRHRDGRWRHLEIVLTNLLSEPSVQGIVVNALDVTERLDDHGARSSLSMFRRAADDAAVMVWITDPAERVVFFNRRWYEFTGRLPDEELGDGWVTGVHPEDRDRVLRAFQDRYENRQPYEIDYRLRTGQGVYRWVVDVGVPRYERDGSFAGHVGTVIDVTDRVEADAARHQPESRFRALVQYSYDLVAIYDTEGRFVFASPSFWRVLGYEPDELVGKAGVDFLHPDDRDRVATTFSDPVLDSSAPISFEHRMRHRDGTWRWLESVAIRLDHDPAIGGVLVNARDITERRRAEFVAADQARILEGVARGAPLDSTLDAVARLIDCWVPDGRAAVLVYAAEPGGVHVAAAPKLPKTGVDALQRLEVLADALGHHPAVHRFPPDSDRLDEPTRTLMSQGFRSWWGASIVDANDEQLGAVLVLRADEAEPALDDRRLLDVATSVSAIAVGRDRTEARLSHQALHDTLTGLPNRSQAVDRLRRIGRHERKGGPDVAVMFLDLDRLKAVNDSAGHAAGDRLLVCVGERLQAALRPGDLVARFGGDEFVIVCEQLDGAEAAFMVAERLLAIVRRPFRFDDTEVTVTASIGIVLADGRPPEALLEDADVAMYRAKEKGRNRVELFAQLREDVVKQFDAQRGLSNGGFPGR